jgi:hypothetical protein
MGQHISINPEDHPSVIIIRIKSITKLENALSFILNNNIKAFPFFESLFNGEMTAFSTEPLTEEIQILLKKFQLIKENDFCLKEEL